MNIDLRKDNIIVLRHVAANAGVYAELAKVLRILVDNLNHIYLEFELYRTTEFNENLDCYEIEKVEPVQVQLRNLNELEIEDVFKEFIIHGKSYIILRKIN